MRARLAVHVHSDWSHDARLSLAEVASVLARHGYDGVLMTEHDTDFDEERFQAYRAACAATTGPLLVPGVEYSDPEGRVHVPVWGAPRFLGAGRPTGHVLAEAAELGSVAMLAHPGRAAAAERFRPDWARHLTMIEIWNRKYDGVAPDAAALGLWRRHPGLIAVAGLDLHTRRQLFPLALEVDLAGPLSEAAVLHALRAGRCRARALGLPAERFGQGSLAAAARVAESGRRRAARTRRRMRAGDARSRRGAR